MTPVAGMDGATKNFGLACPDGALLTLNARAKSEDPFRRLGQLEGILVRTLDLHPPRPVLVVIEGYLPHTPGVIATIRAGEVGGMARCVVYRLGAHLVVCPPGTLKRFATGNGAADKPAMVARAVAARRQDRRSQPGRRLPSPPPRADGCRRHLTDHRPRGRGRGRVDVARF